jgi:hypothetical protein
VDTSQPYCNGTSPSVQWSFVVGCFRGSLLSSRVEQFDPAYTAPAECVSVFKQGEVHDWATPPSELRRKAVQLDPRILLLAIVGLLGFCAVFALARRCVRCRAKGTQYSRMNEDSATPDLAALDEFDYDPTVMVDPAELEMVEWELDREEFPSARAI